MVGTATLVLELPNLSNILRSTRSTYQSTVSDRPPLTLAGFDAKNTKRDWISTHKEGEKPLTVFKLPRALPFLTGRTRVRVNIQRSALKLIRPDRVLSDANHPAQAPIGELEFALSNLLDVGWPGPLFETIDQQSDTDGHE